MDEARASRGPIFHMHSSTERAASLVGGCAFIKWLEVATYLRSQEPDHLLRTFLEYGIGKSPVERKPLALAWLK